MLDLIDGSKAVETEVSYSRITFEGGRESTEKLVFFFDIDNCLYPRSRGVRDHMRLLIGINPKLTIHRIPPTDLIKWSEQYFTTHLSVSPEDATRLQNTYNVQYGLALEGLVRHHKIDPLEYNRLVDDALPLEELIRPDPTVRELLLQIDRSKVRLWLFTNAYITHGERVVELLNIRDLFEGMTYCDYADPPLICKPDTRSYVKAMAEAGIAEGSKCYFVDDSDLNTAAASALGWHTAHLIEPHDLEPANRVADFTIRDLTQLKACFPDLFQ